MKQVVTNEQRQGWLYGAGCLLSLEIFIAAFLHDGIVRPYVGDFVVVIFLYCLVRSLAVVRPTPTIGAVLVFAYAVEVSQYFHLAAHLGVGVQHSSLAALVLGSHFSWGDMLAYTLGAGLLAGLEWGLATRRVGLRAAGASGRRG